MTLPSKGSHSTDIDGRTYRWTATGSANVGYMRVVLQQEAPQRGQTLVACVRGDLLSDWPHRFDHAAIRVLVREAVMRGWDPSGRGTLELDVTLD